MAAQISGHAFALKALFAERYIRAIPHIALDYFDRLCAREWPPIEKPGARPDLK